jgi:hypothetical protein
METEANPMSVTALYTASSTSQQQQQPAAPTTSSAPPAALPDPLHRLPAPTKAREGQGQEWW